VRPLFASDICQIWELGYAQHPVDRALTLLTYACPETGWDQLVELSVGEREARLLTLREVTFGPTLAGRADCPRCTKPLEFTTTTAAMRVTAPDQRDSNENALMEGGFEVRFRLPNSRDLAAVAACEDADTARRSLVERCVLEANSDGAPVTASELPPGIVTTLATRMAGCDPQAEVLLKLSCPACGHQWRVLFDILTFLWSELAAQAKRLLHQVHTLALAYGWHEADILEMSAHRRRLYLEMVT
jgi:hypothetical protein